ncbi:hypothetical protein HAX54_011918, partial [Datura stramonium]|nr:hypothetical protein [Datura stramonium]
MENGKKAQHQLDDRKVDKENLQYENKVKVPSKNTEDIQNEGFKKQGIGKQQKGWRREQVWNQKQLASDKRQTNQFEVLQTEEGVHDDEKNDELQQPKAPGKKDNHDRYEEGLREMHTPNSYGKQTDTTSQGSVTAHRPAGRKDVDAQTAIVLWKPDDNMLDKIEGMNEVYKRKSREMPDLQELSEIQKQELRDQLEDETIHENIDNACQDGDLSPRKRDDMNNRVKK